MFPWCWYKVQTSLANSTCPSALFNIFLVFALVPPICSATKWDRWTSMTVSSSIIPISLKIHGNKENYPRASRVWPWFEHALLVFLINWLYSCTRSDTFAQNNLSNSWKTLPKIAALVLPVPRFPINIISSFDISCSALKFLTLLWALLERMLIFSFRYDEKKLISYGMKREALLCEWHCTKKFCDQSYQNSIDK